MRQKTWIVLIATMLPTTRDATLYLVVGLMRIAVTARPFSKVKIVGIVFL